MAAEVGLVVRICMYTNAFESSEMRSNKQCRDGEDPARVWRGWWCTVRTKALVHRLSAPSASFGIDDFGPVFFEVAQQASASQEHVLEVSSGELVIHPIRLGCQLPRAYRLSLESHCDCAKIEAPQRD